MTESLPAMLGIAARAYRRGLSTDYYGVTSVPLLAVYPQCLSSLTLLLVVRAPREGELLPSYRISFVDTQDPANHGQVLLTAAGGGQSLREDGGKLFGDLLTAPPHRFDEVSNDTPFGVIGFPESGVVLLPVSMPPITITRPTALRVECEVNGSARVLGEIRFGFVHSPPLTAEERRALLANPLCHRKVVFQLQCACGATRAIYESLDDTPPDSTGNSSEWIRASDHPNVWHCDCGRQQDMRFIIDSVPALLRGQQNLGQGEGVGMDIPYHNHRLAEVEESYRKLIESAEREEDVQQFLQKHSVFWSFLSPKRILPKPRILTKAVADFAVVSSQHSLILVEIEKPATTLLRKDGGRSAEVQRAFDQIAEWREVVTSHFGALLEMLSVGKNEVRDVRYLVIAGRDSGHAAKLRQTLPPQTDFLTFDEVAAYLTVVRSQLAQL